MATATQNKRLEQRFKLWDTDGDGRISAKDYESEARTILKNLSEPMDSIRAKHLMTAFQHLWEFVAKKAGIQTNGYLSYDQFQTVTHEELIHPGDEGFSRVLRPTIRAIVDLVDKEGDGKVNLPEYRKWLKAVGVDAAKAEQAFNQLDAGNEGELTVDELVHAVRDYHLGRIDVPMLGI
ncbi:MAG TPA: EF-hand domain-containing protein [Pseudonocardiaceae bacterium]|jgi:Ca2+-binding EF-hand superfamily protein|nr:EF-hand domain-containing protein [Pseudonocardiaceae bacterium]